MHFRHSAFFYDSDDFARPITHPGGCDTSDRFVSRRFKSHRLWESTAKDARTIIVHRGASLCHKRRTFAASEVIAIDVQYNRALDGMQRE